MFIVKMKSVVEILDQTDGGSRFEKMIWRKVLRDPWYSVRRFLVDSFYYGIIKEIPEDASILDLGGKKSGKRGCFDISLSKTDVIYANLSENPPPDLVCLAESIALKDGIFDAVICSETLEHLPDPRPALSEMARMLKPGGKAYITVPFLYHVHGDPLDYGRYTKFFWETESLKYGFSSIIIKSQGGFYITLANMIKMWIWGFAPITFYRKIIYKIVRFLMPFLMQLLISFDRRNNGNPILEFHTIGYEIILVKN